MEQVVTSSLLRGRGPVRWAIMGGVAGAVSVLLFFAFTGSFHGADFLFSDFLHRRQVAAGASMPDAGRVAYLTLTDETYRGFARNVLDRGWLGRVNRELDRAGAASVAYDIIFNQPAPTAAEDEAFRLSLVDTEKVLLPAGFALCEGECPPGPLQELTEVDMDLSGPRLEDDSAAGDFYFARRGIYQLDSFASAAAGSGHVSAPLDSDRIIRHFALVIRHGDHYVPALALAIFLRDQDLSFGDLTVVPGRALIVPPRPDRGRLDELRIPIDDLGRVYIPFREVWNKDFPQMRADELLQYAGDPELSGNLFDFFSDRHVLIGDVSAGASDAADTPLERRVPLLAVHAQLLNALFLGRFYERTGSALAMAVVLVFAILLIGGAVLRKAAVFYAVGAVCFVFLFALATIAFDHYRLVPAVTLAGGLLFIFAATFASLRIGLSRERTAGLRRLNTELFALKSHLEDLVGERTRDLKASLKQIEDDLETARQVQERILPDPKLELTGLEFHYVYEPLDRVGGDLIDITEIRPGITRVFVADAVGHGVQASLMTMAVNGEYQDIKLAFENPADLLREYNRRLIDKYNMRLFTYIPCLVCDVDLERGLIRHASCGMPDQYVVPPGGAPVVLEHTGPAVGFMKQVNIRSVENDFAPGARVVLYSDGLPETHNEQNDLLGEAGVADMLAESGDLDPRSLVDALLDRAAAHRGNFQVLDDLTLVVLRRKIGDE